MYYHEYYLELLKYGENPYHEGKINLVNSPCGSGKSFHCNELIKNYSDSNKNIYYVTDTRMLRETVEQSLPKNVITLTYQKFGMIFSDDKAKVDFLENTQLLICDEIHSLFMYARKFNGDSTDEDERYYKKAIQWLYLLPRHMMVLALSGTPGEFIEYTNNEKRMDLVNNVVADVIVKQLNQQKITNHLSVSSVSEWIENDFVLECGKQAVGYTGTIDSLLELKTILKNKGYRVQVLWSKNNQRIMDNEQKDLYDYIQKHNEIPKDIDVLIFNEAYVSGWNLENNGSDRIQTVFVNSSCITTQTQVVNRVRHDINLFVTNKPVSKNSDFYNREWCNSEFKRVCDILIKYWNNSYLTTKKEKDSLCNDLSIMYGKRRIIHTIRLLNNYLELLFIRKEYNSIDVRGCIKPLYNTFLLEYATSINRQFIIDEVTFYDDNGKQHKNAWQVRHDISGVNKGDKRSLFQKVQYLKSINYDPKEASCELDLDVKIVEDNWEQQNKPQKNHSKSKLNKDDRILAIKELKSKGYKQKDVAEELEISLRTVKNYWNYLI